MSGFTIMSDGNINKRDFLMSVVIFCFRNGNYLRDTLNSIFTQTFQDIEVIIITNSTSKSEELKKTFAGIYPIRIQSVNFNLSCLFEMYNQAINYANSEFIAILDEDDLLAPTFLEKCYWTLWCNPFFGVVYTKCLHYQPVWQNFVQPTMVLRKARWSQLRSHEACGKQCANLNILDQLRTANIFAKFIPEPLSVSNYHDHKLSAQFSDRTLLRQHLVQKYSLKNAISNVQLQIHRLYIFLKRITPYFVKRQIKYILGKSNFIYNQHIAYNTIHLYPDKTHLLFIVPSIEIGGAEKVLFDMISHLNRNQFELSVIVTSSASAMRLDKFMSVIDRIYFLPHYIDSFSQYANIVLSYIKNSNVDVVHIAISDVGYYLLPLIKKYIPNIKVVEVLHNNHVFIKYSKTFSKYIDTTVVVSEQLRTEMLQHLTKIPLLVIRNGIDTTLWHPANIQEGKLRRELEISNDMRIISFIGRFSHEKGPDIFLKIVHKYFSKYYDNKLVFCMVGSGDEMKYCHSLVKKFALNHHVKFLGFRDDIATILRDSYLLIVPSRNEGLPIVVLEAMSMKVPVLAFRVGGIPELVQHEKTGFLFEHTAIDQFCSILAMLLSNPNKKKQFGEAARVLVMQQFDLKTMIASYEKLYLSLRHNKI